MPEDVTELCSKGVARSRAWPHWVVPPALALAALAVIGASWARLRRWRDYDGGKPRQGWAASVGDVTAGGGMTEAAVPSRGPDMGRAEVKAPVRAKLIETTAWGQVPANQIGVMLADGKTRADAEAIARTLGGRVVGELEFINTYQIETDGSIEADLRAALDQAAALEGVERVFPNMQVSPD